MPRPQQHFTIHTGSTTPPQRLTHAAQEFLVAPCIMIVEGVLNGGYVPGEEIAQCQWSGMPLVVNHPTDTAGGAISANDPDVLQTYGVGRVYRTQITAAQHGDHALTRAHAELWLDIAKVNTLGGEAVQALQMLESQQPLEVSTAFYSDAAEQRGSFYGVPYTMTHRNLRADHLALLPNGTGACSWQSGCGTPRLNAQAACACQHPEEIRPMENTSTGWQTFVAMLRHLTRRETPALVIAQTDVDVREALYGALAREMGTDYTPIFIDAINLEALTFTYRQGERLRQRSWQMTDGVLTLTDTSTDVQRETTYTPVPVTQEQQEDDPMSTPPVSAVKARVNSLITNAATGWTETDRLMLESMNEAQLIRLEAQPRQAPATEPPKPRTFEEMLADADHEIRESHQEALENITERKQAAIALLTVNKTCPFSEDELRAMTAKRLEKLVAMSGAELPSPRADYSGRGLATPRPAAVDPMTLPPEPPKVLELVVQRQKEMGLRV